MNITTIGVQHNMSDDIVSLEYAIKSLIKAIEALNDSTQQNTEKLQEWLDLEEEAEEEATREIDMASDSTQEDDRDMVTERNSGRGVKRRLS